MTWRSLRQKHSLARKKTGVAWSPVCTKNGKLGI